MFLGQYHHSIDSKGRLTIPARFRDLLEAGAFVTRGFERNLMVLTPAAFTQMVALLDELSLTDPEARQLRRLILSHADQVEVDKAGRILLQQFLRDFAGLDGDTIVAGQGSYFEIWAPPTWEAQVAPLNDTEATAQRFRALHISASRS